MLVLSYMEAKRYEIAYHLLPTLDEGELAHTIESVRKLVEGAGGVIVQEHAPEHFTLAYPLVKKKGGKNEVYETSYFGYMHVTAQSEAADRVGNALHAFDEFLRFLIVEIPEEAVTAPRHARAAMQMPHTDEAPEKHESMSKEAMDKEIEKLIAE